MPISDTHPRHIRSIELRHRVIELRKSGMQLKEIAAEVGCSVTHVHWCIRKVTRKLNEEWQEGAKEVARIELERLDRLWKAVWGPATRGDLKAIDRALAIMERRAKLLGLDAPTKVAHTDPSGTGPAVIHLTANQLSDDELAAIAAGSSPTPALPPPCPPEPVIVHDLHVSDVPCGTSPPTDSVCAG